MKKGLLKITMTIIAITFILGVVFASGIIPQHKPIKSTVDILTSIPSWELDRHGHIKREQKLLNIAKLLKVLNQQDARIKALEVRVTELDKSAQ